MGADNTLPRESAHSSVVENVQIRATRPIDILARGISISINRHFSAGFGNLNRHLRLDGIDGIDVFFFGVSGFWSYEISENFGM